MAKGMNQKIRCVSCNKPIAEGQLPASIKIVCKECGAMNDLSLPTDKTKPFSERLKLEKKDELGPKQFIGPDGKKYYRGIYKDIPYSE